MVEQVMVVVSMVVDGLCDGACDGLCDVSGGYGNEVGGECASDDGW